MQQVDHYLRQARAALDLAATAESAAARSQFEGIAEGWERLARERLAVLQSKPETANGSATVMDGAIQNVTGESIRLDS